MGFLIDVVKRAQSLGSGEGQEAGLCGLQPTWLEAEAPSRGEGQGDLSCLCGVPAGLDSIDLRAEEEKRLVAELQARTNDSLSLFFVDGLLRPYFEQVLSRSNSSPNPKVGSLSNDNSGHASADKKRTSRTPFPKILKRVAPVLGQKLLSSVLRACITLKNWDLVRAMLDSHALLGNTYTDLVPTLIEHDEASLLCVWIRNICDPRFSDLVLVLKYFLKSSLRAGKSLAGVRYQWRQTALVAITRLSAVMSAADRKDEDMGEDSDGEDADGLDHVKGKPFKENEKSKALLVSVAVDHFQPFELCLHYLVASGHDEAVLVCIVSQLDNNEVLKLLRYLKKWLEKYAKQGSLCTFHRGRKDFWVPSLNDVLRWVSVLLDAHLTSLVLCHEFHCEIQSVQVLIKGLVDVGRRLAPLVGSIEHLRISGVLPMPTPAHGEDDHVIEYLEI